jgi:serine/threonine-protein kinase
MLGRYEISKELGKGAMGIVYLGKDPKINREVAIKTLRFEDEFDAEDQKIMKERFFREAESAGRLVHPNIVTIYDAGDDGDISYIAMELLSGTDLKDFSAKSKLLPTNEVIEIIAKVADALDYAHSEGVVHRDIKPANIMRLIDGKIKVADFGIARITSQSKTATGTVMGTPSYMAPEQLAGKKVDGRADLFSLGVTLYELLTGEKPFTGDSVATLMFRIANEPHPAITSARADLPPAVQAVIDKALQKDPEKRFARGADFARELRAVVSRAAAAGA